MQEHAGTCGHLSNHGPVDVHYACSHDTPLSPPRLINDLMISNINIDPEVDYLRFSRELFLLAQQAKTVCAKVHR